MGNVWLDATAPYVLVAALGAMGWIVNTSVADLKAAKIIEYEVNNEEVDGKHLKNVDIYNRSMTHELSSGVFSFRCVGITTGDCFSLSANGTPITFIPLSGVSNNSTIRADGPIFKAVAKLAPQSAVRYQINMKSPQEEIALLYEPDDRVQAESAGLIFRHGESWEGWLIANYLGYLIRAFLGLSILLALWFAISLIALIVQWCKKPSEALAPKEVETIKVIIQPGGA
jgi:hypothetical protein